jgi:hypothetical protein
MSPVLLPSIFATHLIALCLLHPHLLKVQGLGELKHLKLDRLHIIMDAFSMQYEVTWS